MIERTEIDGKPATVAYLTRGGDGSFQLVDVKDATLVKVVFDDGNVVFGTKEMAEKSTIDEASAATP